jgi:hypothetical protein
MKLPHRRSFLHLAAGAAALPAVSRIARAQAYPSRPVRIIVGQAAGSGSGPGAQQPQQGPYLARGDQTGDRFRPQQTRRQCANCRR